jgi:membrane fusion protein (multidrug efflux system)
MNKLQLGWKSPSHEQATGISVDYAAVPLRLLAIAGALAVVLSGCSPANGSAAPTSGPPPAQVAVQKLAASDVPASYEYVAQTAGSREVEVRARVSGILIKRNFAEGRAVKRDESLYSIDAAPFRAALQRANADVAAAEARHDQAARNLARLTPLWEAEAVSRRDYDDAVSAEAVTRADVQRARAVHAQAALDLNYTRVESPIAGVAGRSQVSEGTLVSGPQVLLTTVTQTNPIKVRFGIADTDQMRWRQEVASGSLTLPKQNAFDVEVKLADGTVHPYKGKLAFSDTRVSRTTGTIEVEAEVPNPNGTLMPGQFVRARLLGAIHPQALRVPARAVLEGPQGKFVYVAAGGKAVPKPVQVGEQSAEGWIINQGLAAGDEVIIDGMARIFFPGAPVQVAAPADAAAPDAKVALAK